MGNTLKCFRGEEEDGHFHGRRDRYPYYQPQYYSYGGGDPHPPAAAPRPHQQGLAAGPHDFVTFIPLTQVPINPIHNSTSSNIHTDTVLFISFPFACVPTV
jgi:hypothetical protein